MTKRTLYRGSAIGLVIILAVILFWIGKGHNFLFDNKEITLNGKTYPALELIQVAIDGQDAIQVRSGMRKQIKSPVAGPWHTITVEVIENKAVTRMVTKKFSVNLAEMFVVNLPVLLEDDPQWIQEFVPEKQ
jgi:hypothetical protein